MDVDRQVVFQDGVVNMGGTIVQHPHQDRETVDEGVVGAGLVHDIVGPKNDVGKDLHLLLHGVVGRYRIVYAIIDVRMKNVEVDGSCSMWDEVQGDLPVGANNRVAQDGHSRGWCHRDINAVGKGAFTQAVCDAHPIPAAFAAVGDIDINDPRSVAESVGSRPPVACRERELFCLQVYGIPFAVYGVAD